MKKMVYVAVAEEFLKKPEYIEEAFDIAYSFVADECISAATNAKEYLTKRELASTKHHVAGYNIDCQTGETAREAYRRAVLDDVLGSPEFYQEI